MTRNPEYRPCAVTIFDTHALEAACDSRFPASYWADHNGSCDCNRGHAFGLPLSDLGYCEGWSRFIVVGCNDPSYTLDELNSGYPTPIVREALTRYATLREEQTT